MGRPSKLTESQWNEIGRRLLAGESAADLAREYGISPTRISMRFSKRNETVKNVAKQIVETHEALLSLNVSDQIAAVSLADELKAISKHLGGAGRLGAITAHRLAGIANAQVDKIDDVDPLKDSGALIAVATLTKTANLASEIGFNLIKASKDMQPEDDKPTPVSITFGIKDARRDVSHQP